jgi:hypothetical protein
MNTNENNHESIFEINRIDQSNKLDDKKKEIHLPKLKKNLPNNSALNYFPRRENQE